MMCNTPSAPPHQKYPFMSLIAGKGRASKAVSIVTAALLSLAFPTSGGSNRRLACSLQDIGQGVFEKQCHNHTKLDQTRINRVLGGAARPNRSRQPLAACRTLTWLRYPSPLLRRRDLKIGRASCRERGCEYVLISGGAV